MQRASSENQEKKKEWKLQLELRKARKTSACGKTI
jgi:hypothetical protein